MPLHDDKQKIMTSCTTENVSAAFLCNVSYLPQLNNFIHCEVMTNIIKEQNRYIHSVSHIIIF